MNYPNLPLVSAVIPVYNGERYVAETIESILCQTYPAVECIVIDDGSTDDTCRVCESFGDRIRYFWKPNGGVSSARNRGIAEAAGEFIAFLDADDKWFPNKIERQVDVMINSNAGLCLTGVVFIDGDGNEIGRNGVPDSDQLVRNIVTLSSNTGFIATTGLARRSALEAVGLFDENLSTAADADMVLRFALLSKILPLDEPLALYRHHTGQMHHNLNALKRDGNSLFSKFFADKSLPPKFAKLRRPAFSGLEASLAIGSLSGMRITDALNHFARSLFYHPITAFSKIIAVLSAKIR
ncbi:MAG: glycosyltransferase [Acidobacteriota bacterium]|nr:MAG: glycosyltransferase [Acidobacteriota bacterium]